MKLGDCVCGYFLTHYKEENKEKVKLTIISIEVFPCEEVYHKPKLPVFP